MHQSSLDHCAAFIREYLPDGLARIADVGASAEGGCYRHSFDNPEWEYVGFDIHAGGNVDVVLSDPEDWQLDSKYVESFDVVISGQTLEHVRRPWKWIKDVASLCKSGGLIWICAPNTWEFHEFPIDCWRIWPDGMRALFAEAGLVEISCFYKGPDTIGIARKS
jgi:SAM-dependent methyltransferase